MSTKNLAIEITKPQGFYARLSNDTVIVEGHSVPNWKAPPEEWRLGRACPKRAEYAAALGWTKLFLPPPSSPVAYSWLLKRARAIIVPANLSFHLPRDVYQRDHRSLVFWRHAKYGVGVDGFDERTCPGLARHEQRISCCPGVSADGSKLLSVAGEELIVLMTEQINWLRRMDIKVGCWEGWKEDGSYSHPSSHHPTFCFLNDVIRSSESPHEPDIQAL